LKSLIVKSPCKVNLGLKILNQRLDGYHNILSIFIQLDLYDVLEFFPAKETSINFSNSLISNELNSINSAVEILSSYCNVNIKQRIKIKKNIPIGGGLGGGSSNAAYTLLALNRLYNLNLSSMILEKLACKIGSDVPFFIKGGVKQISKTGYDIKEIKYDSVKNKFFLLVMPKFSISTKWAYNKVKKHLHAQRNHPKFPPLDDKVDWALFKNDFEHIVCLAYPEILNIKDILYEQGALYSGLSGSGSTMFGIYNDIIAAKKAASNLNKYHTHIASPLI
jgi:4-diphosphocytidyl-2-C-methyl-D-erythritol kinase